MKCTLKDRQLSLALDDNRFDNSVAESTGNTKLSDKELDTCRQLLSLQGMLKREDADYEISKLSENQLAFCERQISNCSLKTYLVAGVPYNDGTDDEEDDEIPLQSIVCKPDDECPICLSKLPHQSNCVQYLICCGKLVCVACITSIYTTHVENTKEKLRSGKAIENEVPLCPFCRDPVPTSAEESVQRLERRIDEHPFDHRAKCLLASCYVDDGSAGILPRDVGKAIDLFSSAAELGSPLACVSLGCMYDPFSSQDFVEPSVRKSLYYYYSAAEAGNVEALYRLGVLTFVFALDKRLAFKHFMSAALQGCDNSLRVTREGYIQGYVSKDEYEKILRGWFKSHKESTLEANLRAKGMYSERLGGTQGVFVAFRGSCY